MSTITNFLGLVISEAYVLTALAPSCTIEPNFPRLHRVMPVELLEFFDSFALSREACSLPNRTNLLGCDCPQFDLFLRFAHD